MDKIPQSKVIQRLASENSWWNEPFKIPSLYSNYLPRPYLNLFYPYVVNGEVQRAIILMGPRRIGKTVLLHHVIERLIQKGVPPKTICYVAVDHPLYNDLDLESFLDAFQKATGIDYTKEDCFLFFDEIQYLKKWESYLKQLVDKYRNIRCVVSGSSAAALRLKSLESGAGRFTNFLLPPLAFYEYLHLLGKKDIVLIEESDSGHAHTISTDTIHTLNKHFLDYLNFGGYPEVALSKEIRKNPGQFVKSDIIDKVLLRDLPSLYGIDDIQELNYLFTSLAFNTAKEVSLEQVSQGSGVTKNTIKRYIDYLEAAFLIKTVHRVDRTAKRFQRANFFKVYLTNASMRAALFNVIDENDAAIGSLVETAIFSHWFHEPSLTLHYARWAKGEVDIVALGPNQKACWAVEVKWSDRYFKSPEELKNLIQFCHEQNLPTAMITSKTVRASFLYKNVKMQFTPSSLYCYLLGYNVIHRRPILEGLAAK